MKVVFMGTPEFAVAVLDSLLEGGHQVAAVYTRPDRPKGRGRRSGPPAVKAAAISRGLAVRQTASLRTDAALVDLQALAPEVVVVAAYGLLLPPGVLAVPTLG